MISLNKYTRLLANRSHDNVFIVRIKDCYYILMSLMFLQRFELYEILW